MQMLDDLIDDFDKFLASPDDFGDDFKIELVARYYVAFSKLVKEKTGFTINQQAMNRDGIEYADIRSIRTALASCQAQIAHELAVSSAASSSVIAHAASNASVSLSISQAVGVVQHSALSNVEKDALELAMSRMRNAAEKKNEKGFADKLKDAIDIASKAAGLVPAIVQAAGQLATML